MWPIIINNNNTKGKVIVCNKLNAMSNIHLWKLIIALVPENGQRDSVIFFLEERIGVLESSLNEIKKPNTDVMAPHRDVMTVVPVS